MRGSDRSKWGTGSRRRRYPVRRVAVGPALSGRPRDLASGRGPRFAIRRDVQRRTSRDLVALSRRARRAVSGPRLGGSAPAPSSRSGRSRDSAERSIVRPRAAPGRGSGSESRTGGADLHFDRRRRPRHRPPRGDRPRPAGRLPSCVCSSAGTNAARTRPVLLGLGHGARAVDVVQADATSRRLDVAVEPDLVRRRARSEREDHERRENERTTNDRADARAASGGVAEAGRAGGRARRRGRRRGGRR